MEWLARLDPRVLIFGIVLIGLLLSLPFFLGSVRRMRRLQLVRGTLFLLSGGVLVLMVVAAVLVAANLVTYARLTHEQEAARVTTRQLAEREFAVSVQTPDRPPRQYSLRGDEWQIDARVLKWRALGNLLGFDTVYRLERLSGRYGDVQSERSAPRTVHELAQDPGVDFWSMARRYHDYLPLADALYGSAAYVPMAEGAEYVVTVSASGLVVRPANDAAKNAVGGWK
jgi:membrane protein implicated in regulation of membrane protease activity